MGIELPGGIVRSPSTAQDYVREYGILNVRHFGARGDGVTDDTAAFQAAVNAAAGVAPLYIPSATYLLGGTITLAVGSANPSPVLYTQQVSGATTSSAPGVYPMRVPAGQYYSVTVSGATLLAPQLLGD